MSEPSGRSVDEVLDGADAFFLKKDPIHRTLRRLTERLAHEGIHLIRLEKLIEIKLASGLSASHRLRDLADVQDLIRIRQLPLELAEELDSSVRDEYRRLWYAVNKAPE